MMISYFVMGKPEILHSSQLRKAFRPRSQSVETQALVAYGEVRQVKKMPFPRCVDLFYDMWKLIFVARNGGGIQMMFCSRTSWFQEEFAEPNTIGIVAILRTLSCNRIPILFGQFSRGISMIFDVQ